MLPPIANALAKRTHMRVSDPTISGRARPPPSSRIASEDPRRYFTDMATRLVNDWPNSHIRDLMPQCWAAPQQA